MWRHPHIRSTLRALRIFGPKRQVVVPVLASGVEGGRGMEVAWLPRGSMACKARLWFCHQPYPSSSSADQEFASRNKPDKLIRLLRASRHAHSVALVNVVLPRMLNIPDGFRLADEKPTIAAAMTSLVKVGLDNTTGAWVESFLTDCLTVQSLKAVRQKSSCDACLARPLWLLTSTTTTLCLASRHNRGRPHLSPIKTWQPFQFATLPAWSWKTILCAYSSESTAYMLCVQHPSHGPVPRAHSYSTTVDISLLLKKDDEETRILSSQATIPRRDSVPSGATTATGSTPVSTGSSVPLKRQLSGGHAHPSESPAKKQSKWSAEEDAKIIQLRGDGMKWEDISKHLPGRSAISCRLHYQNYLERRSEWDEDRKNKLARLYERYVEKRCTRSRATNSDCWQPAIQIQGWDVVQNCGRDDDTMACGRGNALADGRAWYGPKGGRDTLFTYKQC